MPATTNAALKMSSPGEPCSQLLKMMAYCKTEAKSIRAMKKHLAVTDAVVHQLLADALEKGLLRKQPNGMYKTLKDAQPANESLLALASAEQSQADYDQQLNSQWQASCEATDGETAEAAAETQQQIEARTDFVLATQQMETIEQAALPDPDEEVIELDIPELAESFDVGVMASEFEQEQQRNDFPVIDDIAAKETALNYCSLLLQPGSIELKRCIDAIQMDYAVIRLHQSRRA